MKYAIDTANKKNTRVIRLEKKPVTLYFSNFKLIRLTVKEIKSPSESREAIFYFENWKLLSKQDKFNLVKNLKPFIEEAKTEIPRWFYK